MNKTLLLFILKYFHIILTFCIAVQTWALDLNIREEEGKIYCGQGFKEQRDSLVVLHLIGAPIEIGFQYGKLADLDIVQARQFWQSRLPAFELNNLPLVPGQAALSRVYLTSQILPNLQSQTPEEYLTELQGISSALSGKAAVKDLLALNAVYDLYQFSDCITMAAREHATRMGNIIVGKNIQSFGAGYIDRTRRVCLYEPQEGLAFVTIGPAGITGAVDGMNVNGLVVCFTPLPVVQDSLRNEIFSLDGMPLVFLLRKALQYGTSFEEAIRIITRTPRTRSGMVLVADAQTNRVVFVEFTPHDYAITDMKETTLWGTNHFQSPRFSDAYYEGLGGSYQERFFARDRTLGDMVIKYLGRLDLSTAVACLRTKNSVQFSGITYLGDYDRSLCQLNTLSSIIFMPDELSFWIPQAGYYPITENQYIGFTLYREFTMEYEREITLQNVPASGLTNDDLFLAMQEVARADQLAENGDFPAALTVYEKALGPVATGNPLNLIYTVEKLSEAQFAAGDYHGCLASFDRILALLPGAPQTIATRELKVKVLTKKGMVYDLLTLRPQALECYREAAGTGDIYYTGWRNQAEGFIKKKYEKNK